MDRLTNTIRPYAWGSTTALPTLLGVEPTGEPQAEMWMGAHPAAPSRIDRGAGERALSDVIAADPEGELGAATVAKFGPGCPSCSRSSPPAPRSPSRSTPTWTRPGRVSRTRSAVGSRSTRTTATTRTPTTSPK